MALSTGDKLGPYEILGSIGKGGMGEVYRARDPRLGRDVAVKVASEHFSERFEREARAIAALNHSNICAVYDVGPNYLVMELIEGPTLAERIAEGPLPVPEALAIATQVAEALEAAHDNGIVHRDLKPGNIKITPEGKVKVLDFGLAKIGGGAAVESSENSPTISMHATKAGIILGTAAYMSPEQARGKSVDKRADIWSFGVVLYEMVTGRKLFAGEDLTETLASVVKEKADLSAAPPELHPLLEKCLEKDPRKRLRDISGVALLLDRNNTASRSAEQRAAAPSRRLVWGLGAIAALAISVAAVFAALWLRPSPLPKVTRFEVHAPAGSTLPYGTPAISPDGRTLAYTVTDSKGVTRIHLRPMDRVETRVLPGTEDAMHPFWSPDGQSLGFATLNMLKRIDIQGGSPHDLTRVSGPWHGDWNQFGEILFQAQNGIQRMSAQIGPASPVQRGGFPFFLADGKRFLFRFDGNPASSIRLGTLDSPISTPVVENAFSAPLLARTPNGKAYLMYLRPPDLFIQEFDEVSGVVRGQPKVLVSGIGVVANPAIRPAVGVSPSGILAYQTGRNSSNGQLQWIDRSGKKMGSLSRENSGRFQSISPDGSHVAIEKPDADGAPQIWITDLTRGSSTRISFGTGNNYRPIWSPDGKRVAYQVDREGKIKTYTMNADGSGEEQVLLEVGGLASWSPDGTYFLTSRNGQMEVVPGDGKTKPVPVGARIGQSTQGQFSPDGKYIAFASDASGIQEVYLQPLPPATGQIKVSVNGGRSPRWRRDGKELFFVSPENDMMAVDVNLTGAVSTSVPHALFRYMDVLPSEYAVRPDGQQFLVLDYQGNGADAPIIVVLNWWVELEK